MHRIVLHSSPGQHSLEVPQQRQGVYLRLQGKLYHLVKCLRLGVHHSYRHRDPLRAQFHTLVRVGHHQVVGAAVLELGRNLPGTAAVGEGLHHDGQPGSARHAVAQDVEVARQRIQVHLQHRGM